MKKSLLSSILIVLCISINIVAQPVIQWDKTFGGSGQDELYDVKQTPDGGYILAGVSASGVGGDKTQPAVGDYDYWLVKTDQNGVKLWDKTFGGSGIEGFGKVALANDGGFVLAGTSLSGAGFDKTEPSRGQEDFWIVKVSSDGIKQWDKTIGGSGGDYFRSIVPTNDGGYILGGYTTSGISGDKSSPLKSSLSCWVIKLSGTGTIEWEKTFGGNTGDSYLGSIIQTADGGFAMACSSNSDVGLDKSQPPLNASTDCWIVKLDASGNKQWDKTIGGYQQDRAGTIEQMSDGSYVVGAFSNSFIGGDKSEDRRGTILSAIQKLSRSASIPGSR